MIKCQLKTIASAVDGRLHPESDDMFIISAFSDSRAAKNGNSLFFAIPGERVDGHHFLPEILQKGNAAVVSDPRAFVKNTVLVENTKNAVYRLAEYYRENICYRPKAICVTGSVGKTTTKDMLGLVFSASFPTYVTPGNRNSLIGMPFSLLETDNSHEYAILELGMSERGEIARLSALARPWISVITNIGSSHMEALGSRENIKKEKFDILAGMRPGGQLILNADNEPEWKEGKNHLENTAFCGINNNNAQFNAVNTVFLPESSEFDLDYHGCRTHIKLNVAGKHNVYNALYAFAAAQLCGADPKKTARALASFAPSGNRQNTYVKNGITVIADCYNASPESMGAAFDVLRFSAGRKIGVIGDMLELGTDSEKLHAEVGAQAASVCDALVFIGDMEQVYSDAAGQCHEKAGFTIAQKKMAAEYIKGLVKQGDTVLFKASNRLHLEDIIKEVGLCKDISDT